MLYVGRPPALFMSLAVGLQSSLLGQHRSKAFLQHRRSTCCGTFWALLVLNSPTSIGAMIFGAVSHVTCNARVALQCACIRELSCSTNQHLAGAPLWSILQAGEWRSPAFMSYLDLHTLETELVIQAHCDESDEELV